jgi:hypothetical protein
MLVLLMGGIYDFRCVMVSGAMIFIPSFIKIGSGIQKLIAGDSHTETHIHIYTHRAR